MVMKFCQHEYCVAGKIGYVIHTTERPQGYYLEEICPICGGSGVTEWIETEADKKLKNAQKSGIFRRYLQRGNPSNGIQDLGGLLDLIDMIEWEEFQTMLRTFPADCQT